MLTKIEKELNNLMKSRGVDCDTRCGIMYTLKTEQNYKLMIKWISENLQAGQYEIMGRWNVLRADNKNTVHAVPRSSRKTRKIAVF